ncbi:phosphonate ABC transporter, permease protein PhnE [Demequina aestuarii]|uniref:phosphonate ABC transporter, permease protein PhnE n=1 Tax=Demequina aestuarii TaxID=327095 RepID=UPI000781BC55|nr:phosphonate ABC transporter, permease protein PhnE [Demequina aestuarii]
MNARDETPANATASAGRASAVRPQEPSKARSTLVWIALLLVFAGAAFLSDARWSQIIGIFTDGGKYLVLMAEGLFQNPLQEPQSEQWTLAFERMMESVYMAWVGTLLGALISVPFGFLAARNVSGPVTVQVTRAFLNLIRAVPELVFAIVIMLPIFGFGPLAGALALGVGAVGTLGKLTAEALEGIDAGPVEAGQASGASRWSILRWAYWTQVLPEVLAFWLYRFEINIRASAVLGVIGAGGIGSLLSQLFGQREWEQIGITLAVVIIVTIGVDAISGAIRHRIIAGSGRSVSTEEKAEATV